MSVFLFAFGVVLGVIGLFTIGFGIPIHDFSFGNTLILSGAIAVVGGLLLIGLGAAVRELRKLTRALDRPGLPPRPVSADARSGAPSPKVPFPPKPAMPAPGPARPQRAEPRLDMTTDAPPMSGNEPPAADRPRPNIFGAVRGEGVPTPPMVEEYESVPLSPVAPSRDDIGFEPRPEQKPMPEPAMRPAGPAVAGPTAPAPGFIPPAPARPVPRFELPRQADLPRPPAERAPAERPSRNMFDSVWPTEAKAPGDMPVEPQVRRPDLEAPRRAEPEAPRRPLFEEPQHIDVAPRNESPPRADAPKPVSILKSGVIDGMAYTLYTDGSIEAQLPQGVMRFASIDELRLHLEKNS